jgi:hypothetical protein
MSLAVSSDKTAVKLVIHYIHFTREKCNFSCFFNNKQIHILYMYIYLIIKYPVFLSFIIKIVFNHMFNKFFHGCASRCLLSPTPATARGLRWNEQWKQSMISTVTLLWTLWAEPAKPYVVSWAWMVWMFTIQ